jgi:hypothetical protein
MHIQIVNFHLNGLSHDDYAKACEEVFGPAFTQVDGLLSKIWLANAETNTYGGVYTWNDKAAMLAFQQTDLFRSVLSNPNLSGLSSVDFSVLELPTRLTRGFARAA